MYAVINEKQLTEEQTAQVELEQIAPEKFDPDLQFKINKHASNVKKDMQYKVLTREETAALVAASHAPHVAPPSHFQRTDYPTYTREQAEALVREHYGYNTEEHMRDKWDSQKTTELGPKIKPRQKRSTSTRG